VRKHDAPTCRGPGGLIGYGRCTITLSMCSHFGHSNVWRSNPGLIGSIRERCICVVHFGHGGRSMGRGVEGTYPGCGMLVLLSDR
jgi:hypothetical protein